MSKRLQRYIATLRASVKGTALYRGRMLYRYKAPATSSDNEDFWIIVNGKRINIGPTNPPDPTNINAYYGTLQGKSKIDASVPGLLKRIMDHTREARRQHKHEMLMIQEHDRGLAAMYSANPLPTLFELQNPTRNTPYVQTTHKSRQRFEAVERDPRSGKFVIQPFSETTVIVSEEPTFKEYYFNYADEKPIRVSMLLPHPPTKVVFDPTKESDHG